MTAQRWLWVAAIVLAVVAVWVVSGADRADVPATRFFSEEQIVRADAYRLPLYRAVAARIALDLALLAVLGFTAAGDWLGRLRGRRWILGAAAAIAAVVLIRVLLRLPLSFWAGYLHEHAWGFSTQTAGEWFLDLARSIGVSLAVLVPAYVVAVGVVRLFPRRWPAILAPGAAVLVIAVSFLWPIAVEPVFHRFEPLRGPQGERFQALARRAGVEIDEVLVADASRRTRKENAYVSGFGNTKRLVVYDTLLRGASPEEVELVVAHELGHRRAGHVVWGTLIAAATASAGVVVLWVAARSSRVRAAARAEGPADPRFLPVLLLVIAALNLAVLPPGNRISRAFEERADRDALALTGDRGVYVRAERRLALRNLSDLDPGPVAYRFLFTHPPAPERVSYAFGG